MQTRPHIGFFGVLVLVALRMATGWHFFDQGVDKFDPNFSSEGFLRAAKGPLAETFQSMAHGVHDVDTLLLAPSRWTDETEAMVAAHIGWEKNYLSAVDLAAKTKKPLNPPTPPKAGPYSAWLEQISADWRQDSQAAAAAAGADAAEFETIYNDWRDKLANYLRTQAGAMAEHQNELWRLEQLRSDAPAGTLPYNDERAAKKYSETFSDSRPWIASVRSLEALYRNELIDAAEAAGGSRDAAAKAVTPWTQLDTVNELVKWTVVGAGACLILGLFTRVAAVVAAGFLCSVIATQPPWVYGAQTEYFWYQLVEVCGLLAVAVFGAGRWIGLDAMWKHLGRR